MATALFTTVVNRDQGDQITEPIWDDQLRDNLNQLAGSHRNQLNNGGMEVAQRGAGPFTASGYTLDRWLLTISGTTTVTQETTVVDGGGASMKVIVSGGLQAYLDQKIENFAELRGKTISVSVRIYQATAGNTANMSLLDGVGSAVATFSSTTGAWTTLTATLTIDAAATQIMVRLLASSGATVYFDNAMLVIGPAPAPFRPLPPAEDLARCQRYYERVSCKMTGYALVGIAIGQSVYYRATKAVTPTLTKVGTFGVLNCGQPTVAALFAPHDRNGCYVEAVAAATGTASFGPNSADDYFEVVADI